jgi:hypothetical protein
MHLNHGVTNKLMSLTERFVNDAGSSFSSNLPVQFVSYEGGLIRLRNRNGGWKRITARYNSALGLTPDFERKIGLSTKNTITRWCNSKSFEQES